jgi:hypothetical protein
VAVAADTLVDGSTAFKRRLIQTSDQSRMIDVTFIFRDLDCEQFSGGQELSGAVGTTRLQFEQVADKIQKLLTTGELIDLSGRHERCRELNDLLDVRLSDAERFTRA